MEKQQIAYEQAIKAYQFHVQRYHTWVHYYAIFTGALFVAFYKAMFDFSVDGCMANHSMTSLPVEWWFALLIAFLGWFASICWLASIVGHYQWMLSWINIVKLRERRYFEGKDENDEAIFVYDGVFPSKKDNDKSNQMLPKYISTQKVTQIFVWVVMLAWIAVVFLLGLVAGWGVCCALMFPFLLLIFSLVSCITIFFRTGKRYSSTRLKIREEDE